jgi:LPS export ABC transporter protein LptC
MKADMKTKLIAALAALACAACNGTTAPVASNYQSLPADNVMYGMTHQMSNDGIRGSVLKADTALFFNDSSKIQLRVVDLELFTEQGATRATVRSRAGSLDENTKAMVARGNVVLVVKGENGRTIYTEELHYNPDSHELWSDVPSEQVFPDGRRTKVQSFRSDDKFERFTAVGLTGSTGIKF